MESGDESEYEYLSSQGGSVPPTPTLLRQVDAVSEFLLPAPLSAEEASGVAAGGRGATFYTPAAAAAHLNGLVGDLMSTLAQSMGVQVSAERALLLLQAAGSKTRVLDSFAADAGSSSAASAGGALRQSAAAAAAAAAAGLFASTNDAPPAAPPPQGPFSCGLSGEDYDSAAAAGAAALTCGHYYSREAWAEKLAWAARSFPSGKPGAVRCPHAACLMRIPLSWWLRALPPARHAALREAILREVFEHASAHAVACPGAGCELWCASSGSASSASGGLDVRCPAGHAFCMGCGETQAHEPATCLQVREWSKPASATNALEMYKNELVANADYPGRMERRGWDCPSCGALVEKTGGCRHFKHDKTQRGCGHEFCWSCLKRWPCHGQDLAASYACTDEPSNVAPLHLFGEQGVDITKLFRWAWDKFSTADKALDEASALAGAVKAPALGEYLESLMAGGGSSSGGAAGSGGAGSSASASSSSGGGGSSASSVFAGSVVSLMGEAADAAVRTYQIAKWSALFGSARAAPHFCCALALCNHTLAPTPPLPPSPQPTWWPLPRRRSPPFCARCLRTPRACWSRR